MRIPGIYVEIKGDFSQLKTDMKEAQATVKSQARGMSDALNNALSPTQITSSTMGLVRNLGQVQRSSRLTGDEFDQLGTDLGELRRHTGLTEAAFQQLQSRMLRTRAADTTERALKNIQRQAGLTRLELAKLQLSMGDSRGAFNTFLQGVGGWRGLATQITAATAAVTAAGVGLGYFVKRGLDANDVIGKTADYIGISTDALQEYQWAAELTGVSNENLTKGLRRFARSLGDAAEGRGSEFIKILDQYNISLKDASGNMRTTEAILNDYADAIKNATSEQERLRLAAAAFGQFGVQLINTFRGGAAGLNEFREEARELGIVIDEELIRNSETANDQLSRLSKVIGTQLKSAVGEVAPEISEFAQVMLDNRGIFGDWISGASELASNLMKVAGAMTQLSNLKLPKLPPGLGDWLGFILKMDKLGSQAGENILKRFGIGINQSQTYQFKPGEVEAGRSMTAAGMNFADQIAADIGGVADVAIDKITSTLRDVEPYILEAAKQTGLPPSLIAGVIQVESGYRQYAESNKGAVGYMQVMPSTAGMSREKLLEPGANIMAGATILTKLIEELGSVKLALAAYNAGIGTVKAYGNQVPPYEETHKFISQVTSSSFGAVSELQSILDKKREMERHTGEEIGKNYRFVWEQDTRTRLDEINEQKAAKLAQGEDDKSVQVWYNSEIAAMNKRAAEEQAGITRKMVDERRRLTENQFALEREDVEETYQHYLDKTGDVVEATKWRAAQMADITRREAEAARAAAGAGSSTGGSAGGSVAAARGNANERIKIIEDLKARTIKAAGDEFAYKKMMLDREGEEIRKRFAGDKEVMEAWDEFYKTRMAELRGESRGGILSGFGEDLAGAVKNMTSEWASGLNDMLWGAESTFDDILQRFGKMITEMMIQKLVIDQLFASTGIFGNLFGGGSAAAAAQGMVFSSGGHYVPFARGGVVERPQYFKFREGGAFRNGLMGEAGPEAILPLRRLPGGDLGVRAQGGGGGKLEQKIIINNTVPNTKASASTDDQGNIIVMVEQVEGIMANRMNRGTGLAPALDSRYVRRR